MTTLLPPGTKVHLAFGYTDIRKGIDGSPCLLLHWRVRPSRAQMVWIPDGRLRMGSDRHHAGRMCIAVCHRRVQSNLVRMPRIRIKPEIDMARAMISAGRNRLKGVSLRNS